MIPAGKAPFKPQKFALCDHRSNALQPLPGMLRGHDYTPRGSHRSGADAWLCGRWPRKNLLCRRFTLRSGPWRQAGRPGGPAPWPCAARSSCAWLTVWRVGRPSCLFAVPCGFLSPSGGKDGGILHSFAPACNGPVAVYEARSARRGRLARVRDEPDDAQPTARAHIHRSASCDVRTSVASFRSARSQPSRTSSWRWKRHQKTKLSSRSALA